MALVAAASLLLGGWVEVPRLRHRAEGYRARARTHAARESRYRRMLDLEAQRRAYWSAMAVEWARRAEASTDSRDSWADLASQAKTLAECRRERVTRLSGDLGHHAALRRKYELAAARPWLPIWPDPPPPE